MVIIKFYLHKILNKVLTIIKISYFIKSQQEMTNNMSNSK